MTQTQLYVSQSGNQSGPYTFDEVQQKLSEREYAPTDHVWYEGLQDWIELGLLPGMRSPAPEAVNHSSASPSPPPLPGVQSSAPFTGNDNTVVSLSCENCRGALDYSPGNELAHCPFCGSKHLIKLEQGAYHILRDYDGDRLSISYTEPTLTSKDAIDIIIRAIAKTDGGYKQPEHLKIVAVTAYMPIWTVSANVQCSWQGEYSEKRTVTKWRKVRKQGAGGSSYEVDEPYNDTETVWHPSSGVHSFSTSLNIPAAATLSRHHLGAIYSKHTVSGNKLGHPSPDERISLIQPNLSQSQAWKSAHASDLIDDEAVMECRRCIERLKNVRAVTERQHFTLVFIPLALVSYTANESQFRHFVNLTTGSYSGDLPLDERTVKVECASAGRIQFVRDIVVWHLKTLWLVLLTFLGTHIAGENFGMFTDIWIFWVGGLLVTALIYISFGKPWEDFIWKRRTHLMRILADPPAHLVKKMYEGEEPTKIQQQIRELAANNLLESLDRGAALPVLQRPAKALLSELSPLSQLRLPEIFTWLIRIPLVGAAIVAALAMLR